MYSIYCLFTYEGMPQIYGQPLFLHHCYPAVEKLHKLSFAHTLGIPAVFSAICVWNRTAKQFLCMYVCMYIRMYVFRHLHINIHVQVGVAYFFYICVPMYVRTYAT